MNQLDLDLTYTTHIPANQPGMHVVYVLLKCHTQPTHQQRAALHYVVVADASPSMRIPFVDEATFREIMRQGFAQEVMIDGFPVWKLQAGIPKEFHDRVHSPSRWLRRAIGSLSERLNQHDRLSVIAFGEKPILLVDSVQPNNPKYLRSILKQLDTIQVGDSTALAPALDLTFERLTQHAHIGQKVIIITDGFAQDSAACLEITKRFTETHIPISTIGLGFEFAEHLLIQLADQTGGHSYLVANAIDIAPVLDQEIKHSLQSQAYGGYIQCRLSQGVAIRRAYRIQPALAELQPITVEHQSLQLALGDLDSQSPQTMLLEVVAPQHNPGIFRLLSASVHATHSSGQPIQTAPHDVIVTYAPNAPGVPHPDLAILVKRVIAWRLQNEAFKELHNGDLAKATIKLHRASQRYLELGETILANQVAETANNLARTGSIDTQQTKKLQYTTRRLTPLK